MANAKISQLPEATTLDTADLIAVVDVSEEATKKITRNNFKTSLSISKADVGLSNVDNTSDIDKPISNAAQLAIDALDSKRVISSIVNDLIISDSLLNNTGLSFNVGAGEKWAFMVVLQTQVSSNTGVAYSMSAPAGTTGRVRYQGLANTTTSITTSNKSDLSLTSFVFQTGGAGPGWVEVHGVIQTIASGTMELQAQSQTSQTFTIRKESYIQATRIA